MKHITFIHIPKTAGSSIYNGLRRGDPDVHIWRGHETARLRLRRLEQAIGKQSAKEVWDSSFKFTFIRNPWDRMVSWFFFIQRNNMLRDMTFEDWADDNFRVPNFQGKARDLIFEPREERFLAQQECWYQDDTWDTTVDFIGRFEHIEEDFAKLCALTGIHGTLGHDNKTEHKHYRECYTDASKAKVAEICEDLIYDYGYTF